LFIWISDTFIKFDIFKAEGACSLVTWYVKRFRPNQKICRKLD